jgi:hypothetical protein
MSYTCQHCKGVFESGWSDDEALKEMKENFGPDLAKDDCVIVCDDCYNAIMGWAKEKHIPLREGETK